MKGSSAPALTSAVPQALAKLCQRFFPASTAGTTEGTGRLWR